MSDRKYQHSSLAHLAQMLNKNISISRKTFDDILQSVDTIQEILAQNPTKIADANHQAIFLKGLLQGIINYNAPQKSKQPGSEAPPTVGE